MVARPIASTQDVAQREAVDRYWMRLAIAVARRGEGHVEPNPMVGCVVVSHAPGQPASLTADASPYTTAANTSASHAEDRQATLLQETIQALPTPPHGIPASALGTPIGVGYHAAFGGPHAEVNALASLSSAQLKRATVYTTLEPCSHFGKTPPCTDLLLRLQPARVVTALQDPFPAVAGRGIEILRRAGIDVHVGVLQDEVERLCAPYLKRMRTGRPWIIAKWAMSLDGKLATATGDSRWISNVESRAQVHAVRGRCDGILVGLQTALADDPLLTARPAGPRIPVRIVADSQARLPVGSQLVKTARDFPTLVAASTQANPERVARLQAHGLEVWQSSAADANQRLIELLDELGRRGMTNVLVEGGGTLLGALHDLRAIDEVHAFIAPRLIGGTQAVVPVQGAGIAQMIDVTQLDDVRWQIVGDNAYCIGRVKPN